MTHSIKRQLSAVALGALATLTLTAGMGTATADRDAAEPTPGGTLTLNVGSARKAPARWQEDSLPAELYLWADVYGGRLLSPRGGADAWANDAERALARAEHRRPVRLVGCWGAEADTTLVVCPAWAGDQVVIGRRFYS